MRSFRQLRAVSSVQNHVVTRRGIALARPTSGHKSLTPGRLMANNRAMSDPLDPKVNPETPWEFLPDDEVDEDGEELSAEETAMHIEVPGERKPLPHADPPVVAHYMPDEQPEVYDPTEPVEEMERTPDVDEILIRQHYIDPQGD